MDDYVERLRATVTREGLAEKRYGDIFGGTELARKRLGPAASDHDVDVLAAMYAICAPDFDLDAALDRE